MLKKNDFIEIEYTGYVKENDAVFDTTDEKTAKDNGLHNPRMKYGAILICIGQGQLIPGLDKHLEGKELGQDYTIDIPPEEAFGKKDAKMIQLISTSKFKKENINPMPGMQVNIDEQYGIVKTVSGGRTLVDFNHPLAGKDVVYKIKIINKVDDIVRKVSSLVGAMLQIEEPKVIIIDGKAEVELAFDLPDDVREVLNKKILEVVSEIKEVKYTKKSEDKKEAKPETKAEPKPEPK